MALARYVVLPLSLAALTACESEAERQADTVEDQMEAQAEQSAAASGDAVVAMGLTERQLLDADLVAEDGAELGDIEQVRRDASGVVTGLLVEIEDSDPDRYVQVPLTGLSAKEGTLGDIDVQTSMTSQELAALPEAPMGNP